MLIAITGSNGFIGKHLVKSIKSKGHQVRLIQKLKGPNVFQINDISTFDNWAKALEGVDIVIHCAALKQVSTAEFNPIEYIETNVLGSENLVQACLESGVSKVVALSTDKASSPINLYGATKLCADKLFIAANNIIGKQDIKFSVVRYGNVMGSRGSVIPFFLREASKNELPITDINMTRFNILLHEGVDMVIWALKNMKGGEIFVPKIPSIKIKDLIYAISNTKEYKLIGIRPGEKLHEVMIPTEESLNCIEMKNFFIIQPMLSWWDRTKINSNIKKNGKKVIKPFEYSSENNKNFLKVTEIRKLIKYL